MEIEATVKIILPIDSATDEQIQEWLEFQFGARGGIGTDNPLHEYDCDAHSVIY